jgi:hypothetical protein
MRDFSSGNGEAFLKLIGCIILLIWMLGQTGCATTASLESLEGDKLVGYDNAQEPASIQRDTRHLPAGTTVVVDGNITTFTLPVETTWSFLRATLGIPRDTAAQDMIAAERRYLMFGAAAVGAMAILVFFLPFVPAGMKGGISFALGVVAAYLWAMWQWQGFIANNQWVYYLVFGAPAAIIMVELFYFRPRRKKDKKNKKKDVL